MLPLRELYIQLFHGVSLLNSNGGVPTLPGQEEEQPDDRQIVHDGRDAEHTAHNVLERVKQRQRGQHRVEGRQQPRRAQPEQNEQHDSPHAEHRDARGQPLADNADENRCDEHDDHKSNECQQIAGGEHGLDAVHNVGNKQCAEGGEVG